MPVITSVAPQRQVDAAAKRCSGRRENLLGKRYLLNTRWIARNGKMAKYKVISLRVMTSAGWADTFSGVTVEEHPEAFITVSPVILLIRARSTVVIKLEVIPLRIMAASSGAFSFPRKPVEKHHMAFIAISPVRLCVRVLRGRRIGKYIGRPIEEREVVTLSVMSTTRGTATFSRIAVKEKVVASVAVAPIPLVCKKR